MLSLHIEGHRTEDWSLQFNRMAFHQDAWGQTGAKLPLQTGCVGLYSKHGSDSSLGNSMSITCKIGAGCSPWLP